MLAPRRFILYLRRASTEHLQAFGTRRTRRTLKSRKKAGKQPKWAMAQKGDARGKKKLRDNARGKYGGLQVACLACCVRVEQSCHPGLRGT